MAEEDTETQRLSNALRSQETMNRQLMDAFADGVFIAQDLRFVHANAALAALLGYAHDAFVDLPFDRVLAPDSLREWTTLFLMRVGSAPEAARATETVFLHADGSRVELELVATPTRHSQRPAVLGVVRDIAERKRVEARLARLVEERTAEATAATEAQRDLQTFARRVTDNLSSPIAYVSRDRRLLFANDAWLEWFGVQPEGVGLPLAEIVEAQLLKRLLPEIDRALAGESVECVDELTSASGETRFFRMSRRPDLRDGVVRGYSLLATDVSELRQSELRLETANEALAAAERFTRNVADNLPVRIAYWDRELRCRFVNRAYSEWYGWSAKDLLGRRHDELFHDGELQTRMRILRGALAGRAITMPLESTSASGQTCLSQVHVTPDRRGDAVDGVLVMAIDITAQHRAQTALEHLNVQLVAARDRAEAGTKAKSGFLANMSHEIRTPMNAIIGLTHLLRRDSREPHDRERLGQVHDAAQHLLQIVDDVLDLSKVEAGKLRVESTVFDLGELLSRCCGLVAEQARGKGLQLVVRSADLPQRLIGDPMRLSQALVNLLANAVKFSERGSVEVTARLGEEGGAALLRFEVRDEGIGIDAEHLPLLFTAFEQGDASTTRRFGGTGLGLALTRMLARLMGGDAGVCSTAGVGSTFWITARVQEASDQAIDARRVVVDERHAERELHARHAGRRLLLAEDNVVNQTVAVSLLEAAGLVVDVASDGARAVEMAASTSYALILMDMQMPRVDGIEATQAIRALPGRERLPIVAMTAGAFGADRAAALAAGMNDHIAKPVDPTLLYATLTRWLDDAGRAEPESASAPEDRYGSARAAERASAPAVAPGLEAYAGIDGLDVARGLVFFADRAEPYAQALQHFVRLYSGGLPGGADADAEPLGRELHSTGSACAMVGASALADEARALQSLARAEAADAGSAPALRQRVAAFSTALAALAAAIGQRQ